MGVSMKRNSQLLCVWFMTWDLALTAAAWIGAYHLRFESGWFPLTAEVPDYGLCLGFLPLVLVLSIVSYRLAGQYHVHRLRRLREEVVSVVRGSALMTLLVIGSIF